MKASTQKLMKGFATHRKYAKMISKGENPRITRHYAAQSHASSRKKVGSAKYREFVKSYWNK